MKFISPYLTFLIAVSVKITSTVAFMKSYKIIDDKYHNEQIKRTSSPVLNTFAVLNGPKQHNFDKICAAFKIAIAAKVSMHLLVKNFPKAKKKKGHFADTENTSANHVSKKAQPTKGELKAFGEMLFSVYDQTCKE